MWSALIAFVLSSWQPNHSRVSSHSLWKPPYSAFRFKPETNAALNTNRLEDSTFLITFLFGMAGKCATPPFSPSIKGEKMVRPGHSRTLPRPGFWILRLARHLWWQRQASDHYPATEGAVRWLSLLDFFEFVMKVLRCWHCMMFVHKNCIIITYLDDLTDVFFFKCCSSFPVIRNRGAASNSI